MGRGWPSWKPPCAGGPVTGVVGAHIIPIGNSQSISAPLAKFSRTDSLLQEGTRRLVACEAYWSICRILARVLGLIRFPADPLAKL